MKGNAVGTPVPASYPRTITFGSPKRAPKKAKAKQPSAKKV
jgi:hypothetical protein